MIPFCAALLLAAAAVAEPDDDGIGKVVEVFSIAREQAADPVPTERAFYEGAIPGMLRRLDPHSVFFDRAQFEQLRELEKSTRKGFGTVVSLLPGRVVILQTLAGTPSSRAGLMPGDEIVAVNGIRLDRLEVEQLVQLLSQARQNQTRLDVRRTGSPGLLQFRMTPEDVESPSVDRAWLIRPGIGFVRVASFDVKTGSEVRAAIEKLGGEKLRGLILDLRNNTGGIMGAALETTAMFLQPGQKILSVKGRRVAGEDINVPADAKGYTFPVAVLVNNKTASGSEIVAGAIQDHKRGRVIGEATFGKGLVQSVYPLSSGTGMALTTAFYYTPSGRSIQRKLPGQLHVGEAVGGIQPDEVVPPEGANQLRAAMELSGSFSAFATRYLRNHSVDASFDVSGSILDDFRDFLVEGRIQPSQAEWSRELPWARSRLRQEILNQAVGVARGDEVEADRDPVVQAALRSIGQ